MIPDNAQNHNLILDNRIALKFNLSQYCVSAFFLFNILEDEIFFFVFQSKRKHINASLTI